MNIERAISVRQPWAWLIVHGGKDIENRTWRTNFRGRVYIHAGKEFDEKALEAFRNRVPGILELGGIIGSVEIVDCVDHSDSEWFMGPHGFVLRNPRPEPFRLMPGKLGFFRVGREGSSGGGRGTTEKANDYKCIRS
jgi:hypothetical protein